MVKVSVANSSIRPRDGTCFTRLTDFLPRFSAACKSWYFGVRKPGPRHPGTSRVAADEGIAAPTWQFGRGIPGFHEMQCASVGLLESGKPEPDRSELQTRSMPPTPLDGSSR